MNFYHIKLQIFQVLIDKFNTVEYKIFWCKVNKYYLNKRLNYFSNNTSPLLQGEVGLDDTKDDYIIATCVVTDKAKNKFIKETIQQIEKNKHIYLTWCAVFDDWKKINEDKFYKIYPELNKYKNKITLLWEEPNRDDTRETTTHQFKSTANIYTKKFIVIQNGCDSYCTFCLTIHKRWKSQNIPSQNIIQEINDFVDTWWKEIVITWINLAARWCTDTKKPQENKFAQLLQEIIDQTKIERIRISSLWPEFLNNDFFEVIKNTRFLPHFHLSIQSFSDKILKSMNRNYNWETLDNVITKLQNLDRPDKNKISIWADIIVGFPWETEDDFMKTVNAIKKYKIQKLHAFPFSWHDKWETIPAHQFQDQIPQHIKKQRNKYLQEIGDSIRQDFIKNNKWLKHKVLIEEIKKWKQQWWTENYIQIEFTKDKNYKKWEIVEIEL